MKWNFFKKLQAKTFHRFSYKWLLVAALQYRHRPPGVPSIPLPSFTCKWSHPCVRCLHLVQIVTLLTRWPHPAPCWLNANSHRPHLSEVDTRRLSDIPGSANHRQPLTPPPSYHAFADERQTNAQWVQRAKTRFDVMLAYKLEVRTVWITLGGVDGLVD